VFLIFPFNLLLTRLDLRLARSIARYESSVSAAIDMVFFAEVIFVEESDPEARNADKKTVWMSSLSFARPQCSIPQIWFQEGSLPGILSVSFIRFERVGAYVVAFVGPLGEPCGVKAFHGAGRWASCLRAVCQASNAGIHAANTAKHPAQEVCSLYQHFLGCHWLGALVRTFGTHYRAELFGMDDDGLV
jgi:hypothetical protein